MLQNKSTHMADDGDTFDGLPIFTAPISPESHSSALDNDPKPTHEQQSSCTLQSQENLLSDYYPSIIATPQQTVENSTSETIAGPIQNHSQKSGKVQHGSAASPQPDLALGDQYHHRQYSTETLQQHLESMWPNQQADFEKGSEYSTTQKQIYETNQTSHPTYKGNEYDSRTLPRSWATSPQRLLQSLPWKPFHPSHHISNHQKSYYPDDFGLATTTMEDTQSNSNSAVYATTMGDLDSSFHIADPSFNNFITTPSTYRSYHSNTESLAMVSPSSYSNTMTFTDKNGQAVCHDHENTIHQPQVDLDQEDIDMIDEIIYGTEDQIDSPSSTGGKMDEPYARLIHKALMSQPNKSMSLQKIYEWFRINTDKAKSEGKGWQNSIRHNLSMNMAFSKRNTKAAVLNSDGSLLLDANPNVDSRKSTEWFLEPRFYGGVVSTTRYRKGNGSNRSRGAAGSGSGGGGGGGGSEGQGGSGSTRGLRVSAGSKGGNVAAKNRKRVRAAERRQQKQQQQQQQQQQVMAVAGAATTTVDMARNTPNQRFHHPVGQTTYHHNSLEKVGKGKSEEEEDLAYADGHHHHHHHHQPPPSSLPAGFGEMPAVVDTRGDLNCANSRSSGSSSANANANANSRHMAGSYFQWQCPGNNAHFERDRILGTDNDNASEPTTPPGSAMDASDGFGCVKHEAYLHPDMEPFDGLHTVVPTASYISGGQQDYDVVGTYEPSLGAEQPPLFWSEGVLSTEELPLVAFGLD